MHHVVHTLTRSATFTVIADYLGPVFLCICLCLHSSSDSKQVESGAKQQAAATEGASEQAQYGSDAYGQAYQ